MVVLQAYSESAIAGVEWESVDKEKEAGKQK